MAASPSNAPVSVLIKLAFLVRTTAIFSSLQGPIVQPVPFSFCFKPSSIQYSNLTRQRICSLLDRPQVIIKRCLLCVFDLVFCFVFLCYAQMSPDRCLISVFSNDQMHKEAVSLQDGPEKSEVSCLHATRRDASHP